MNERNQIAYQFFVWSVCARMLACERAAMHGRDTPTDGRARDKNRLTIWFIVLSVLFNFQFMLDNYRYSSEPFCHSIVPIAWQYISPNESIKIDTLRFIVSFSIRFGIIVVRLSPFAMEFQRHGNGFEQRDEKVAAAIP